MIHTEERACAHECLGQGGQPPEYRIDLTLIAHRERDRFDQAGSLYDIGHSQRMLHRFNRQFMLLVPGAGTTMQEGWQRGLPLLEVTAQDFSKQVVVAIPKSLVVEGDHKEVRPVERLQHDLASPLTRYRITKWPAEAFQDTGVQEKLLHRWGLPRKHLVAQIVEHIAMAATEGR